MERTLVSSVAIALSLCGCTAFDYDGISQRHAPSANLSSYFEDRIEAGKRNLAANRPGRAIEAFRQASYHEHYRGEAFNGMGVAYSMLDREDVAQEFFKRAIEADPLDPRFVRNLARANAQALPRGERLAAIATRDNLVSPSPSSDIRSEDELASVNARLAALDRERAVLEAERSEAQRVATDAAEALARVRREIEAGESSTSEAQNEQRSATDQSVRAQAALDDSPDEARFSARALSKPEAALHVPRVVLQPHGQAAGVVGREVPQALDYTGPLVNRSTPKRSWFASAAIDNPQSGREAPGSSQVLPPANRTVQPASPGRAVSKPSPDTRSENQSVAHDRFAAQRASREEWKTRLTEASQRIDEAVHRLKEIEKEVSQFAARDSVTGDLLTRELAAAQETRNAAQEILEVAETRIARITEKQAQARDARVELLTRSEGGGAGEPKVAIGSVERLKSAPRGLNISIGASIESTRNRSVFVEVLKPTGHEVLIRTGPVRPAREISVGSLEREARPIPVVARTTAAAQTISYQAQSPRPVLRKAGYEFRIEFGDVASLASTQFARSAFVWPQDDLRVF